MGKNFITGALLIASFCFGQDDKLMHDSKFAIGLISGLNYAIYIGDDWPEKTASALRGNVGINLIYGLTSHLSSVCDLSYLRLFYNTNRDYSAYEDPVYEDHITFDNIYVSSGFRMVILRKGLIFPNIGVGLACVWPFTGTWDDFSLSYKNVNNCRALFFSGIFGLKIDKFPLENTFLNLDFHVHYCIAHTFDPYLSHPFVWSKGVAISKSIPLRFTLSLFWNL